MKNYFLLIILVIIGCTKDEPTTIIPPTSNELPPPSFSIPPVSLNPEPDFEYNGGDITIASKEDFLKYRGLVIKEVSGDFNITVDWAFLDGSSDDPSSVTKNIEIIEGDATIVTNNEFSMESLVRVDGVYSVEGHDIRDDNLLYAKKIKLSYEENYEVKPVYSDGIELNLNLGKWKIKKSKEFEGVASKSQNSSKVNNLNTISIVMYHTSLLADVIFDLTNLPTVRDVAPEMPETAIYPTFTQTESTQDGVIESESVEQITLGGHIKVNKIISNSLETLAINNTALDNLTVQSTSVEEISMPLLTTITSLILDCKIVNEFVAPSLVSLDTLTLTGVSVATLEAVETIVTLTVVSGNKINLPSVETISTSTLPSNVRLIASSSSGLSSGPTGGGGGGTSSSSSSSSSSDDHNSGGSGHNSGGSSPGHNSGGSSGG